MSGVPFPQGYKATATNESLGLTLKKSIYVKRNETEVLLQAERRTFVGGRGTSKADGLPVEARIVVEYSTTGPEGRRIQIDSCLADARGCYQVLLDPTATVMSVSAVFPGFAPVEVTPTRLGEYALRANVALSPGGIVRGSVILPDGEPARNALVKVGTFDVVPVAAELASSALLQRIGAGVSRWGEKGANVQRQMIATSCATDAQGSFSCPLILPTRTVIVVINQEQYHPCVLRYSGIFEEGPVVIDVGRIQLACPAEPLRLRFRYEDGQTANGVTVRFQAADVPMFMQVNSPPSVADADGVVRSSFVEEGKPYALYVRGGERGVHMNIEDTIVSQDIVIVLGSDR